jgi:hypothetical protein
VLDAELAAFQAKLNASADKLLANLDDPSKKGKLTQFTLGYSLLVVHYPGLLLVLAIPPMYALIAFYNGAIFP